MSPYSEAIRRKASVIGKIPSSEQQLLSRLEKGAHKLAALATKIRPQATDQGQAKPGSQIRTKKAPQEEDQKIRLMGRSIFPEGITNSASETGQWEAGPNPPKDTFRQPCNHIFNPYTLAGCPATKGQNEVRRIRIRIIP